jgi:hypothetical protein
MKNFEKKELIKIHEELRQLLIDYGCDEFGDCIIDSICMIVGIPDTTNYYEEN